MLVCHKYKFIFIKTSKSAGTSIEIMLSRFLSADDIVTPISSRDEKIRRELGFGGPRNCYAPIFEYGPDDFFRLLFKGKRKLSFYNHMSAAEVRARIGYHLWDEYFKFCFVRNPWDRLISLYYHLHKVGPRPSISKFMESGALENLKRLGPDLYRINGEIAVDKIYRFENLEADLQNALCRLGLPHSLPKVTAKGSSRKDKRKFQDILSEDEIAEIGKLFADEVALMGCETGRF